MRHSFTEEDLEGFATKTEGYSMADLISLLRELAMMPVREITSEKLMEITGMEDIRPVGLEDF